MTQTVPSSAAGTVVRSLVDALRTLDAERIKALLHPDVEVREPASLPYGGVYRTRQAFFEQLFPALVTDFEISLADVQVFDAPGGAAARMTLTFSSRRTGKSLEMPYVEVYEVEDDLVRRIEVFPQDVTALTAFMSSEA
jgi:uncharacterized protein